MNFKNADSLLHSAGIWALSLCHTEWSHNVGGLVIDVTPGMMSDVIILNSS